MKGVKGRILKTLKSIPQHLPPQLLPTADASAQNLLPFFASKQPDTELMTDHEEQQNNKQNDKENIIPTPVDTDPTPKKKKNCSSNAAPFRRPDPNSSTLFDPDLLAAFKQAVMEHLQSREEARSRAWATTEEEEEEEEEPPSKILRTEEEEEEDPLMEFEERCPPGGREAVILYTTSLRGIRKTFEDCRSVRFLLKSLRILFYERDVSMHMEFREELWTVLGGRAIPPRLFIRGRYIGGADEVLGLHEQGRLLPLAKGLPPDSSSGGGEACEVCGGISFIVCSECSGSRRIYGDNEIVQCFECNENGLVVCPLCS